MDVPTAVVTAVEQTLLDLDAQSVTLADAGDHPIFEPLPGEAPLWPIVTVTGLFDQAQIDADQLRQQLQTLHPEAAIRIEPLADQQWERAWMDHYQPFPCGQRLWIVPEWLEPPQPEAINLRLDPGLAFGTGDHASTFLCLQWLDEQTLHGKTVIDYGCGSGILGVAALLLGAKQVWATDIDPQAVLATRQNAALNGVSEALWVDLPAAFQNDLMNNLLSIQADVIVANILARPLLELAASFAQWCKPGGQIVLAGLTCSQVDDIRAGYAPWFDLPECAVRDQDWCRLSGTRKITSEITV